MPEKTKDPLQDSIELRLNQLTQSLITLRQELVNIDAQIDALNARKEQMRAEFFGIARTCDEFQKLIKPEPDNVLPIPTISEVKDKEDKEEGPIEKLIKNPKK